MDEVSEEGIRDPGAAASRARARLSFDLDVDVCVVGGGLAGLTVALECARAGASVAVLEGHHIGWNASGCPLGTVMPGYDVPIGELIERVGFENTRELWALSREGAEYVRANATEEAMPGIALNEGALVVSNVDVGEQLIGRLQMLGEDFETEVEGWQVDRVRDQLKTERYFHGVYYPKAFQIDGRKYVHGLAALARQAGVRIFEDTPAISIDASGVRQRIVTPSARLRADHIVLAGNIHLGTPLQRLSETLLPVWRYAALTAPLGLQLADAIKFTGSVTDTDGIDHFRIVDGDRLMWASPEATWPAKPDNFAASIQRRIGTIFPQLKQVEIADVWGGVIGQTVHGMPQIGELQRGLWVASGFGRQGLNTSAVAGRLIASGIVLGDDRWRLFSPFELVWAGGAAGRAAAHLVGMYNRGRSAAAGVLARHRERARERERIRETRIAEANLKAKSSSPPRKRPSVRPRPKPAVQAGEGESQPAQQAPHAADVSSQESEKVPG